MKTSELTGAALDYAVALIEYPDWKEQGLLECLDDLIFDDGTAYAPSIDWDQGGRIIEREKLSVEWIDSERWLCGWHSGQTPLIAAMRCYVASKLGEDVDIPEELK